jgi:hypothetical protein
MPKPGNSREPAGSPPAESTPDLSNFRQKIETSPNQESAKKSLPPLLAQNFDLGDIVATANWARLSHGYLEVSFSFTNKTGRPLWMVPATRKDKDGIQATDNLKNRYRLRKTIGFKRGSIKLEPSFRYLNEFLVLQPNISAPSSFVFEGNRAAVQGATEIHFFATLTIVEDFTTLRSYDRTVTADLGLD